MPEMSTPTIATDPAAQRAELLYRERMAAVDVPAHLRDGLVRYLVHRIRPGGFLCAILADHLEEAYARADADSRAGVPALYAFLLSTAPTRAWGSYEAIERWLDRGGVLPMRPADAHLGAAESDTTNTMHGGEQ